MENKIYDVAIVGGGVIGTALMFVLSKYTNVEEVILLEKGKELGALVSRSTNNSQTLHFGDIETNYTFEKAKQVNECASWVRAFLLKHDPQQKIYQKFNKMVLAVGKEEVETLEKRYEEFKTLFPHLKKIYREEIAKVEPNVVLGRPENEKIMALFSEDGYTVDFGALAKMFVQEADKKGFEIQLETKLKSIVDDGEFYYLKTNQGTVKAKVAVICVGGYSLLFAKSLGYGKEFAVLPIAGSFYHTPHLLNAKVYTLQDPSLPFAAVHGDPDLDHHDKTRFGPIAKIVFMLERGNYKSIGGFLKVFGLSCGAFVTLLKLAFNWKMFGFILLQTLYDLPLIGKYLFLKDVRKIVPKVEAKDLQKAKGYGGVRPQIIDKTKRWLSFGTARIIGRNAIFNVTPSPGASMCLATALEDAKKVVEFLGTEYNFAEDKFKQELSI